MIELVFYLIKIFTETISLQPTFSNKCMTITPTKFGYQKACMVLGAVSFSSIGSVLRDRTGGGRNLNIFCVNCSCDLSDLSFSLS